MTALMMAANNGSRDIIKSLIKAGANIKAKNNYDATALDIAKSNMRTDILDLLFEGKGLSAFGKK